MSEVLDDTPILELDDEALVNRLTTFYQLAQNGFSEWRDRAETAVEFKRGDQWDDQVRQTLQSEGRPCLTINHILPIIKFLCGAQRQNRKDIRVRPEKGGLNAVAAVLTHLTKHMMLHSGGEFEASDAFERGLTTGKGWLAVDIDYENDPNGKLTIQSIDPFDVYEDPAATEYSLNRTGKYVVWEAWEDRSKCEAQWPDKTDEMREARTSSFADANDVDESVARLMSALWEDPDTDVEADTARRRTRYPVRRFYVKEYQRVGYLKRVADEETMRLVDDAAKRKGRELAKEFPDAATYYERPERVLIRFIMVGNVLVEKTVDPFEGINTFPIFRFCPYHDGRYILGVIDNLIGPQEEENKRRSQALHNLNQTANSGWIVGKVTQAYRRVLEKFGSKSGLVVEADKCGGKLERITPAPISQGHMILSGQASEDLKQISGVANMMGYDAQEKESGRALALRQRQGATITEDIFDNFDRMMQEFGTFVVELIRRGGKYGEPYYSREEIERIVDEEELIDKEYIEQAMQMVERPKPPAIPSDELIAQAGPEMRVRIEQMAAGLMQDFQAEMQLYQQRVQEIARELFFNELRAAETGRYGVSVTESPNSPSARAMNMAELLELAKAVPGAIPPEALIEASDVPNKTKLLEGIREQRQAMAQQAQQQTQTRTLEAVAGM